MFRVLQWCPCDTLIYYEAPPLYYTLSMGSTAFGRASQSYQPEQPPLMEDSDDDIITGQGRIETPKRQSRMSVHSDNWDE